MSALFLNENNFHGELTFDSLPQNLLCLDLRHNPDLSGRVWLYKLPPRLALVDILIRGTKIDQIVDKA